MQQMQQMPVLGAVQSQAAGSTQSQAEMHLHRILGALRKSEDSWTPDIQSAVQEIDQSEMQDQVSKVITSADEIRQAKRAVSEARAARLRLITSWRTFRQYSSNPKRPPNRPRSEHLKPFFSKHSVALEKILLL